LLLSKPGMQGFPAAVFALGLCHLSAGERPSAISCFERALRLLQSPSASLPDPLENGDAYLKLSETQILEKTYLVPMDSVFCGHFPVAAKQTVLLALIHAHMENGSRDQAKRLLPGLAGPVFETFKQQLLKEEEAIQNECLRNKTHL